MGKILEGKAHGGASPGTKGMVRLNALSSMSQIRLDASEMPSVGSTRAHPGAATDARLADQVFSLVYRQMHALWGRYRGDFDDLVQVAAEQALRSLPSFRRDSQLSTWTYRICYHTVRKHQRWSTRWLRRFTLDAPNADAPVRLPGANDALEEHERAERLHRALDTLSAKRRAVVVMRDLEGLGIAEIAEIVQASEPTVRSRLRDARKELSSLLERDSYFGTDACDTEAT